MSDRAPQKIDSSVRAALDEIRGALSGEARRKPDNRNPEPRAGWFRVTGADGSGQVFWLSTPSSYPGAEPCAIQPRKPDTALSSVEERRIRAALDAIHETDVGEIEDMIAICMRDAGMREHWLRRADGLLSPREGRAVTCGPCRNFDRLANHPRLGHCAAGKPEPIAGLWDSDDRVCDRFKRRP